MVHNGVNYSDTSITTNFWKTEIFNHFFYSWIQSNILDSFRSEAAENAT